MGAPGENQGGGNRSRPPPRRANRPHRESGFNGAPEAPQVT